MKNPTCRNATRREGSIVVILVVLLPCLLILATLTISLAYMENARIDLQIASDAASRAACRTHALTHDRGLAIQRAQEIAALNPIVGTTINLSESDIIFGSSRRTVSGARYEFDATAPTINAVQVNFNAQSVGGLRLPFLFGTPERRFAGAQTAIASHSNIDIVLVIDRSGSMAFGTDEAASPTAPPKRAPSGWAFGQAVPPGSRWQDAVNAVDSFLTIAQSSPQQEMISLVSYNHLATFDHDLSSNYGPILDQLNARSAAYQAGSTAIGDAIWAADSLVRSSPSRSPSNVPVMIVLTDGIWNYGSDPIYAADHTNAENHTIVYTVTFSNEADISLMNRVAKAGGGKHFHASTGAELATVFQEIAKDLPVLSTK